MNSENIETFLAVYETKNITQAAKQLMISQSTVSARILQLENELGKQLFLRERGYKQLKVTAAGQVFLPLAYEWLNLDQEMQRMTDKTMRENLTIGAPEILNASMLVPFYQKFAEKYPQIRLRLRTHHSDELYDLLETRQIDVGLVLFKKRNDQINIRELFREKKILLTGINSTYQDGMSIRELPADKEIYLRYDDVYETWHRQYINEKMSYLNAPNAIEAVNFLNIPGSWCIAPYSIYANAVQKEKLAYYSLAEPVPDTVCYEITRKNGQTVNMEVLKLFQNALNGFCEKEVQDVL